MDDVDGGTDDGGGGTDAISGGTGVDGGGGTSLLPLPDTASAVEEVDASWPKERSVSSGKSDDSLVVWAAGSLTDWKYFESASNSSL